VNYIALTGSDMHAMAAAAEILLEQLVAAGIACAVLLYVNDLEQAAAIRATLRAGDVGELWRIGADSLRPELDGCVDAHLARADEQCISAALRGFARQLQPPPEARPCSLPHLEISQ
jgi:hypothetical protein